MKDYSMNCNEREDFILGYNIDEKHDTIIVNFANGEKWVVPYNEKNEKIILDKMEEQVLNSDNFYKRNTCEQKNFAILLKILLPIFGIVTVCMIVGSILNVSFEAGLYVLEGLLGVVTMFSSVIYLKTNYILNDLIINRKFIKIEKELNDNVKKIDQNVLVNTSKKTRNIINNTPQDKPVFNINSFNYVPYSDIEQIMLNIERNERFGFDYECSEVHEKSKTRKRTR